MKKPFINIEIKAKCNNPKKIKQILLSNNAEYKGCDHQIDTYFRVKQGRLKIREGNIENNLIYYQRSNQKGPKQSNVILFKNEKGSSLKDILKRAMDILIVVDKRRDIFFIDNVKFHIDKVKGLGSFVEIEAIDYFSRIGKKKLDGQVNRYLKLFKIEKKDMISESYSDMLLKKKI